MTGVEYYIQHLVEALAACGHALWLYWQTGAGGEHAARLAALPRACCRPFGPRAGWLTVGLPLRLALDRVAVCHFPHGVMPPWCPVPVIVTAFDTTWERVPHLFTREELSLFRRGPGDSCQRADHLIAISDSTRRDLMEVYGIPGERISVVPLAPDPSMTPMPPDEAGAVCSRHGLSRPFLLYAGSPLPWKNLPRLVSAYARAFGGASDAPELVLAGPAGERAEALSAQAEELGVGAQVRHVGYIPREDLRALMSVAQAFVFPSLYEGFGLPPLEAMACGAPVVCSKAASLPEVVGEDALLFDPQDEEEMAHMLQRIAGDEALRRALGTRSLARAAQFTWQRTAEETWAVYEQVAARTSG
jgi:alpha-1,3-rhamnosyl/mannosyltransferase